MHIMWMLTDPRMYPHVVYVTKVEVVYDEVPKTALIGYPAGGKGNRENQLAYFLRVADLIYRQSLKLRLALGTKH